MRKITFLLPLLMLLAGGAVYAQRNCATMEYLQQQLLQHPEMQQRLEQIERHTRETLEQGIRWRADQIYQIPVVVHVVYQNESQNVSNAQVQSQIDVLNEDFRRLNADALDTPDYFAGVAADVSVEFVLAAIERRQTTKRAFGTDDAVKFYDRGGLDAWPACEYLNLWVCELRNNILGYAQFPGGPDATDGVVIHRNAFGRGDYPLFTGYDLGRTTTHEVGHWLNLRHIWGDGGCGVDDFVADTPLAGGANYTGLPCTSQPNSCDEGSGDLPDMFQNYMDYSDDGCMNLFTLGQKDRMRVLFGPGGPRTGFADPLVCGSPPQDEICDDGLDNDGDGLADCADPDCGDAIVCQPSGGCDAPTGLTTKVTRGGRQAELSWSAVAGADNYTLVLTNTSTGSTESLTLSGTSAVATGLTKGATYEWCVAANCSDGAGPTACQTFTAQPGGREALFAASALSVFPNPARDLVSIELNALPAPVLNLAAPDNTPAAAHQYLELTDVTGRIVLRRAVAEERPQLNVAALPAGLYLVKWMDDEGNLLGAGKVVVVKE